MGFCQSSGGGVGVLLLGDGEYGMISSWVRNKDGVGGGRANGRPVGRINHHQTRGALHSAIVHPQWVSCFAGRRKDTRGEPAPQCDHSWPRKNRLFLFSPVARSRVYARLYANKSLSRRAESQ